MTIPAPRFFLKLGDTTPPVTLTLDLSTVSETIVGATVQLNYQLNQPGSPVLHKACTILDTLYNVITYSWVPGDITKAGEYFLDFTVTFLDGKVMTFPNDGELLLEVAPALPIV